MSRVAALWEAWEDEDTLDSPMGPQSALTKRFPDVDLGLWVWVYLGADPTTDPSTWPSPVDFTARLLGEPITISRGRQRGQKTASAGSCTLVLDNHDGALTPLLATSSYYPDWDFGVPIQILVDAVGAAPPYSRFCGYLANVETIIVPTVGGGSTSAVRLTLGSVIRRITQGAEARSPIYRRVWYKAASVLTGYWRMEDGADSTEFGSALPNGTAMSVTSANFASDSALVGSEALPVFDSTTALVGQFTPAAAGTWHFGFYAKFDGTPASLTTLLQLEALGGSAVRWVLSADTTTIYVEGFDSDGVSVHSGSSSTPYATMFSGDWVFIDLLATNGGGMSFAVTPFDSSVGEGFNASGTVTAGTLVRVRSTASAQWDGMAMGHMLAVTGNIASNYVATGESSAPTGFVGELAQDRFIRVGSEEGIPLDTIDQDESFQVGPQPISDTMGILRDLETPDHAVLSELIDDWGFGYIPMSQRYNLDPALTIDLATYRHSGDSADVLTPIRNDQRIRNEWTITRTGGSSATAKDAAHQAKKGRYNDSATVNVYLDSQVRPEAEWRVHEGTTEAQRYAMFPIDLGANNGGSDGSVDLLTAWLNLDLGARIDRISYPDQHSPDRVSLILEGYTERIRRRSWIVEINPEPYDPFDIGTYQDLSPLADAPRYDTEWSTTSGAFVTGTDTTMTVVTSAGPVWTLAPPSGFPILIRVAGAVLSVTNITGASSPQTFTISTTVANGVVKTIPSGSQVRVARPGRYGL